MSTRLELSPEELDLMLAALHAAALRAVAGPGGQRLAAVIQDLHAKVEIAQLAAAAGIRLADADDLKERYALELARTLPGSDPKLAALGAFARARDAEHVAAVALERPRCSCPICRAAALTSSACKREQWCVLQVGHAGVCLPNMMPDGSVIP